jgi:hypothetical protein
MIQELKRDIVVAYVDAMESGKGNMLSEESLYVGDLLKQFPVASKEVGMGMHTIDLVTTMDDFAKDWRKRNPLMPEQILEFVPSYLHSIIGASKLGLLDEETEDAPAGDPGETPGKPVPNLIKQIIARNALGLDDKFRL